MSVVDKPHRRRKGLYEFFGLFLLLLAAFIIWQTVFRPSVTVNIQPTVTQTP